VHGWWWHLFHDSMRANLWSLVALGVILVLGGVALVVLSYLDLPRLVGRRRRGVHRRR
jgi:hypothetical protein